MDHYILEKKRNVIVKNSGEGGGRLNLKGKRRGGTNFLLIKANPSTPDDLKS